MPRWISNTAILFLALLPLANRIHASEPDPRIAEKIRRIESLTPRGNDYTAQSLQRYEQAVFDLYGNDNRTMRLDGKALYYEWILRRYHIAPTHQVHARVILPDNPGELPNYHYGEDASTWNGACLSAFCYKYAVTHDQKTLQLIERILDGLHLYLEVTGKPGLAARCVLHRDTPFADAVNRYVAPDGKVYHFRCDPAKGTYNQLVGGYINLMLHVYDDLSPAKQQLAKHDMTALILHLIKHNYQLTDFDGKKTTYGKMTPLVGTLGVPFNAQVAYMIVAAGAYFPPDDPAEHKLIHKQFRRLRKKHHVYYEKPLTHLVCPQRVGDNPLVKGMNDRNHVVNAAFLGLMLEIDSARRDKRKLDKEFLYQLGRTIYWAMQRMENHHNALCNFMWAGLLSDPQVFKHIAPHQQHKIRKQRDHVVAHGFEQLKRFPIDRFYYPGKKIKTKKPQYVDARRRNDSYLWKSGPFDRWEITGPAQNNHTASIDYLYAYWLMRYFKLDQPTPK